MKYLKKFNESNSYQEPFIYKSPTGLIEDIKEIFYILSDYGCEIGFNEKNDYKLFVDIKPNQINRNFSGFNDLIELRNKLKDDNDYIYVRKLIEVYQHLDQLKDDKGGFNFKFYDPLYGDQQVSLYDYFNILFDFEHDYKAIINDINDKIYLNDDVICDQLKYIDDNAEYSGYELSSGCFFLDFYLNKKYPTQPFLDHFNLIMGEYFKFYLDREECDDFKESGDYYYHLKGDLIKGKMAPQ